MEKCDTLHGSVLYFIVAEVMFKEGSEKEVKSKNKNKNCAYNESPKQPTKLNLMTCKSMHGILNCHMFSHNQYSYKVLKNLKSGILKNFNYFQKIKIQL